MSREVLKYVLQITTVQPKALLHAACKFVHTTLSFFLNNCLSLLRSGSFYNSNGGWVIQEYVVIEEPPEEEIWGIQVRPVRFAFHLSFAADKKPQRFSRSRAVVTLAV